MLDLIDVARVQGRLMASIHQLSIKLGTSEAMKTYIAEWKRVKRELRQSADMFEDTDFTDDVLAEFDKAFNETNLINKFLGYKGFQHGQR